MNAKQLLGGLTLSLLLVPLASAHNHSEGGERQGPPLDRIAEVLEISEDELQDLLEDGAKIRDLLEDAGIEKEDFKPGRHHRLPEEAKEQIADLLGMTTDEVKAAREAGTDIRQMVQDAGLEDEVRSIIEQYHGERTTKRKGKFFEEVATALGMTTEELKAELEDGTKIPELLEAHGLDPEDFRPQHRHGKQGENA